eukprot:2302672-Lingulodinium_polyedra.AAC.1
MPKPLQARPAHMAEGSSRPPKAETVCSQAFSHGPRQLQASQRPRQLSRPAAPQQLKAEPGPGFERPAKAAQAAHVAAKPMPHPGLSFSDARAGTASNAQEHAIQ